MKCLIGESGGTKSDWVLTENGRVIRSFTSESYHPVNWDEEFRSRLFQFWADKEWAKGLQLNLFVAGCFNESKARELESMFSGLPMEVIVRSDLHAAGLAHFGSSGEGKVAIMGTGSVLFDFANGKVQNIRGGLGHLEGDEGSAYYFGKLVLEAYEKQEFDPEIIEKLSYVFNLLGKPHLSDKYGTAQLAQLVAENEIELNFKHRENIEAFIDAHHLTEGETVFLTGSYAWFRKHQIEKELAERGIQIGGVVARPIDRLVELNCRFTV
jgi:glucosamine kinase